MEAHPLRFLVVASACTKEHYRRTLSSLARTISVEIRPGTEITFDVDFRPNGIRRIAVCLDHPMASLFRPNQGEEVGLHLDAALNFFLWVVGRDYNEKSFTKSQASRRRGVPSSAPFTEMHQYVRQEESLQRHLKLDEYEPGFLTWARHYLQEDPAVLLTRGKSLAQALRLNWLRSLSGGFRATDVQSRRAQRYRVAVAKRWGVTHSKYWHGKALKLEQFNTKFFIALPTSKHLRALKIFIGKTVYDLLRKSLKHAFIGFSEEIGLFLKLGDEVIFQRSRERLSQIKIDGDRWVVQLDQELAHQKRDQAPKPLSPREPTPRPLDNDDDPAHFEYPPHHPRIIGAPPVDPAKPQPSQINTNTQAYETDDDFIDVDNAGHSQPPISTMTSTSATAPGRSRVRAGVGHSGDSRVNNDGVSKPASSGKRGRGRPRGARNITHHEAPA